MSMRSVSALVFVAVLRPWAVNLFRTMFGILQAWFDPFEVGRVCTTMTGTAQRLQIRRVVVHRILVAMMYVHPCYDLASIALAAVCLRLLRRLSTRILFVRDFDLSLHPCRHADPIAEHLLLELLHVH